MSHQGSQHTLIALVGRTLARRRHHLIIIQFSFSSADPYYSQAKPGAKSAKTKPVSLSSALDEIMMDMSSSSTIVECYCGQNSCPQCNLLLKMAGSDTQIRIFFKDTFFLQILRCLQMSSYLYFSRSYINYTWDHHGM